MGIFSATHASVVPEMVSACENYFKIHGTYLSYPETRGPYYIKATKIDGMIIWLNTKE